MLPLRLWVESLFASAWLLVVTINSWRSGLAAAALHSLPLSSHGLCSVQLSLFLLVRTPATLV